MLKTYPTELSQVQIKSITQITTKTDSSQSKDRGRVYLTESLRDLHPRQVSRSNQQEWLQGKSKVQPAILLIDSEELAGKAAGLPRHANNLMTTSGRAAEFRQQGNLHKLKESLLRPHMSLLSTVAVKMII